MKTIIKAGIDTLNKSYETELELTDFINHIAISQKNSSENSREKKIAIKPSKAISAGTELTHLQDTLAVIKDIDSTFDVRGNINRLDISADSRILLTDNTKLFRLFLECLNLKREGKGVLQTKKNLVKTGNLKIKNSKRETTVYSCSDLNRIAITRIENRILDIRNSTFGDKKTIINEMKKYLKEINGLEKELVRVEELYISVLIEEYQETIEKKFRNFHEFLAWVDAEGLILTAEILKGVMVGCGIKSSYKYFVQNFRTYRKDTLKFTSKTELKKLISEIKKELKIATKF